MGSSDGSRGLIRQRSSQPRLVVNRVPRFVQCVAFSADGRLLAMAEEATIVVSKAATCREVRRILVPGDAVRGGEALSPAGDRILLSSFEGDAELWDAERGRLLHSLRLPRSYPKQIWNRVVSAEFSPDGRWAATGHWDNHIRL